MNKIRMPSVEVESYGGTQVVPMETRLLTSRKLFLYGSIDAELANSFMASILFLSDVSDEPVTIYIDSPGGEITQGMLIYDVLQNSELQINLVCIGLAASMAAVILAAGQKGRRYILKHSKVMIHEPLISDVYGGSASSVMKISKSLLKTRDMLSGILAEHTAKSVKEINAELANERFMDAEEAIDYGICDSITDSLIIRESYPVNDLERVNIMKKNLLILGENCSYSMDTRETKLNNNVLVVGCSGAGKTHCLVEPNILQANGSYIISDPKGNLYGKYKNFLAKKGYVVKKMDFTNPLESAHYNFFNYIESTTDVVKIAHMLMRRDCNQRQFDPFWDEAAQLLLEALIGYLFELNKKDFAHFGTLMDLLELMDISGDFPDRKSALDRLMEARGNADPDSFAYACFKKMMIAAGRTLKSIFITVNARFGLFDTPELIEMMKKDDIDIESIGQRKTAIFVVVSDTDRSMDLLANIFFSQAAQVLCTYADKNCKDYMLPVPVRFILDDFATNCVIHDTPKLISSIRSREISMMLMVQSESQLTRCFGEDGKTIIANCDTYVYLGGNDVEMAEKIAKRCDVLLKKVLEMPVGKSWIFRRGQKPVYVTNYSIDNMEKNLNYS